MQKDTMIPKKIAGSLLFCCFLLIVSSAAGVSSAAVTQLSEQELLDFFSKAAGWPAPALSSAAQPSKHPRRDERGAQVGKVQSVQGAALIIYEGGTESFRLDQSLPAPVFSGDTLITEKDSRVTLLMQDNSLLTLSPQSKLVLDKAIFKPESGKRDTRLQLLLGRLRAVVSKVTGEDNAFIIQTPTAAAGVRGTDFAVAVAPSPRQPSSLLTVLITGGGASAVELRAAAGGSVLVGPLSAAGVLADAPALPPVALGQTARRVLSGIAPELDSAAEMDSAEPWQKDFLQAEQRCSLAWAAKKSRAAGVAPAEILAFAAKSGRMKILPCLKALGCGGVEKKRVFKAAESVGISDEETLHALERAVTRCGPSARRH
ncbi:FecR family protein [Candidatus Electronema sp. TJ]|uniref:FecR family protein n=1 Tax=Candidatus Electronema sp. TJ TaxID=3401573 RepID=UPI003AA81BCC